MKKMTNNAVRLAVLAALAGTSVAAHAAFPASDVASELPVGGVTFASVAASRVNITPFTPSVAQQLQVTVTLGGGAKFATSAPKLSCAVTTAAGVFSTAASGILNLGGLGTNQAVFTVSAANAAIKSCQVIASGLTVTGAHANVTETLHFKYGTLASSTTNGSLITFNSGVTATVASAATITANVVSGFATFGGNASVTQKFGKVAWNADGTASTATIGALGKLSTYATSGSITVAGNALQATKATAGVWLTSGATCGANTQKTATGGKASITFTALTPAQMSAGLNVCATFDGTTPIQAGSITAQFAGTAKATYSLPTPAALTVGTVSRDGSSLSLLNMPRSTDTDAGFLRVYNTSNLAGAITVTVYDQTGTALATNCTLSDSLAKNAALVMSAAQMESTCGITAPTSGRYRLDIAGAIPSMKGQMFARSAGVLTNVSADK